MTSILMTGASGFIGAELFKRLHRTHNVRCISLKSQFALDLNHDFTDVRTLEMEFRTHGVPDVVIHVGWGNINSNLSPRHLDEHFPRTARFYENAYKLGVQKIIGFGTCDEYEGCNDEYSEEYVGKIFNNKYAEAKAAVAKYGLALAKELNRSYIHLRLFNTYGIGKIRGSLIGYLIERSKTNDDVALTDCAYSRDFIYINDVVRAIEKLQEIEYSGILNIGSGTTYDLKEFIEILWLELGGHIGRLKYGTVPKSQSELPVPFKPANIKKIKDLVGWAPIFDLKNGLKDLVKMLKQGE